MVEKEKSKMLLPQHYWEQPTCYMSEEERQNWAGVLHKNFSEKMIENGFKVVSSNYRGKSESSIYRKNRLTGKVALYTDDGSGLKPIEFTTHMVIVAHKDQEIKVGTTEDKKIKPIDFPSLLDSIIVKNDSIKIDNREFPKGELLGRGQHKEAYLLDDGENDKVIKIVRKDMTTFYSAFSSLQQSVERQFVLKNFGVKYMKIYDYDKSGPPYRFLIQEKIPKGSICASDLIINGELKEENVAQMAQIVNGFENSKQWQIDTNPFNWYRVNKKGKSEMVYIGGTVYRYNENWSFDKVGLPQWVDPKYIEGSQNQSAKIPNQTEAQDFAKRWQNLDTKYATWWKKYLNLNIQPK